MRSQQTSESSSVGQTEGGVPGALSNQPPAPATAPITTQPPRPATPPNPNAPPGSNAAQPPVEAPPPVPAPPTSNRKDATTNYEVDKTIQHIRKPVGGVKRLSVAVVVNYRKVADQGGSSGMQPLSEAEKAQITDLVKEAMGYNRERGDTLNVVNSPFTVTDPEAVPELPLWKQPEMIELAQQLGKMLLIGGLVLYLVLGVLRPIPEAHEPTGSAIARRRHR